MKLALILLAYVVLPNNAAVENANSDQRALELYRTALRLKQLEQFEDASSLLKEAASISKYVAPAAHVLLGTITGLAAGDHATPPEELDHYWRAIHIDPSFSHAYGILSKRLSDHNRFQEAISVARTALKFAKGSDRVQLYRNLGYAHFRLADLQAVRTPTRHQ